MATIRAWRQGGNGLNAQATSSRWRQLPVYDGDVGSVHSVKAAFPNKEGVSNPKLMRLISTDMLVMPPFHR